MTISGVTIGTSRSVSVAARPRNRWRASASPSNVPRIVETTTATAATRSVSNKASTTSSLAKSRGYQSSVNPRHWKLRRESLNENTISTAIGRNRKR